MNLWDIFFSANIAISQGAFMGSVAHYLNGDKKQRKQLIATVLTNYLTAIYLTSFFLEQINSTEARSVAFLIGFVGLRFIESAVDKVFDKFKAITSSDHTHGNPPDSSL
ncbi:hypothetical protein [Telluribacter humicola]|uniref:hypothetical protein n=1 Tax=Telluribacter humicola TaxID=1720261 RepID=UPI001A957B46|nr:hypothetical protein [Telluribacter humicola]